jgi:hypothetical protein
MVVRFAVPGNDGVVANIAESLKGERTVADVVTTLSH